MKGEAVAEMGGMSAVVVSSLAVSVTVASGVSDGSSSTGHEAVHLSRS